MKEKCGELKTELLHNTRICRELKASGGSGQGFYKVVWLRNGSNVFLDTWRHQVTNSEALSLTCYRLLLGCSTNSCFKINISLTPVLCMGCLTSLENGKTKQGRGLLKMVKRELIRVNEMKVRKQCTQ